MKGERVSADVIDSGKKLIQAMEWWQFEDFLISLHVDISAFSKDSTPGERLHTFERQMLLGGLSWEEVISYLQIDKPQSGKLPLQRWNRKLYERVRALTASQLSKLMIDLGLDPNALNNRNSLEERIVALQEQALAADRTESAVEAALNQLFSASITAAFEELKPRVLAVPYEIFRELVSRLKLPVNGFSTSQSPLERWAVLIHLLEASGITPPELSQALSQLLMNGLPKEVAPPEQTARKNVAKARASSVTKDVKSASSEVSPNLPTPSLPPMSEAAVDALLAGEMTVAKLIAPGNLGDVMVGSDIHAWHIAANLASSQNGDVVDSRYLLAGYLLASKPGANKSESALAQAAWDDFSERHPKYVGKIEMWRTVADWAHITVSPSTEISSQILISAGLANILKRSFDIAEELGRKREFTTRYLLLCLLGPREWDHDPKGATGIIGLSLSLLSVRKRFAAWIAKYRSNDPPDVIADLLGLSEPNSTPTTPQSDETSAPANSVPANSVPAQAYVAGPPGYTSEYCGVGGTGPVPDTLGVQPLAHRLAELMSLRETQMPLAVGLFGNWGSGKSHFMNLMDRHMLALSQRSTTSDGPWCQQIVPIYFNAWHYIDTNLWASLVTEIFDGLFRHVAPEKDSPDERSRKIQKLILQLQKAKGAAAGAEEDLELAREAKIRAQEEQEQAEAEAKRVAHRRDQLQGAMAGVLDNLDHLMPEGEVKKGWSEALQILRLDDVRKSLGALSSQVAQFQSLGGRLRAVARAVMAPEQRAWRFGWLLGALLIAPLAGGLIIWMITCWKPGLQPISTVMGEVSGLLVGAVSWCGVQLQRGRDLIGRIEQMERAGRKKQKEMLDSPKLRRTRAKVAKLAMREDIAREQVREARAKIRRIEDELNELRPERRLFRFIEKRAQGTDYRSHLGLVSLVRRDFLELSRLFLETKIPALPPDVGKTTSKAQASIDRIVLFVDDLDRCQPEKVVDVLQAVHLLLAFPLFAVIVGVDQRCLHQSLRQQFKGLVATEPSCSKTQAVSVEESPGQLATPLDYLEKIFHIPFHLPPMNPASFAGLMNNLTKSATQNATEMGQTARPEIQQSKKELNSDSKGTDTGPEHSHDVQQTDAVHHPSRGLSGDISTPPMTAVPLVGSVPLHEWERQALAECHQLIRTPRAATRLLNTYRLVRAGVAEGQDWNTFRGDESTGEFRIVLLLLSAAAGYPALARAWFKLIREAKPSAVFLKNKTHGPEDSAWKSFKVMYDTYFATSDTVPTQAVFVKWLDKVERFCF